MVEEIDDYTQRYDLNRTDIIVESIKFYLQQQRELEFYENFDSSCKSLNKSLKKTDSKTLQTLEELIDEL